MSLRVLVVDDDAQIRFLLQKMFELEGYEVTVAFNGEEALRIYREKPSDVVITDIFMPGKEGLETIVELRSEFPNSKIIAISGGGSHVRKGDALHAALKLGANRTFSKPFDLLKLKEAVQELSGSC